MKESLLQYIWKEQYFNTRDIRTTRGETLQVLSPGQPNLHQGPDFLDARIRIGGIYLAGAIELHVASSGWQKHAHQKDKNYGSVILHVVWTDDSGEVSGMEGRVLPTLVLEHLVSKWMLQQYEAWMKSRDFVPCQQQIGRVTEKVWAVWKAQLTELRLQRKAAPIYDRLKDNHQHWEETCWWLMARAFGGPVNGAAFEMIVQHLPLTLLARHVGNEDQIEALLLGQAGLLEVDIRDEHPLKLQREYRHLRNKYGLPPGSIPVHFLRMRPDGFPSIRLAQLARLLEGSSSWFSRAKEAGMPGELKILMEGTAGPYWNDHYLPDRCSALRVKRLGEALKDRLIINVFVPLLYAYGVLHNDPAQREKAIRWLGDLSPERNVIIDGWAGHGVGCRHAGDSQALLELKKEFCTPKHCLQCAIGKVLLGPCPS